MATSYWVRRIRRLPPDTRAVVDRELVEAAAKNMVATELRVGMPGEGCGRGLCQGDWPVNDKGKVMACPGKPTHVQYAVGGAAHGMPMVMCTPCFVKFSDPNFDWEKGKARF